MPTTTTVHAIVKPTSGAEPADLYGVATRLADSVEAALVALDSTYTDVTYNGAWANFGTPYEEVSYRKTVTGRVELRGSAKHGTTSTTGTVFTLPSGFRPAKTRRFNINANTGAALITIDSAGVVSVIAYVSPTGGTGNATILSFDNVSFDTQA